MIYTVTSNLELEGLANPKKADLSLTELKRGIRTIGGDKGDLHFQGYTLDPERNRTVLYLPVITTTIADLTEDEVNDIALEILRASFESIGLETIEHS